jgi:carbamoyl-phosphate synthase large subunit
MIKNTKRVLISGAGGSLFPYIFTLLQKSCKIIAIDANPLISKIYQHNRVITVPLVNDSIFTDCISEIIQKNRIEYYIPLIDEEIVTAHTIACRFDNLKVIAPVPDFVNLCRNKHILMNCLAENNISTVRTESADRFKFKIGYPLFLKPICGRGSRGSMKIEDRKQYQAYFAFSPTPKKDILIQEYLDGEEYSVSVLVNRRNKLLAIVPKRILLKKGITIHACTVKHSGINRVCEAIVNTLNPAGPFNVQLKTTPKGIKIFEINPRFSTTSILSCAAGLNEFTVCMDYFDKPFITGTFHYRENIYLFRRFESCFYTG